MAFFQPGLRTWWKATVVVYLLTTVGLLGFWTITDTGLFHAIDHAFSSRTGNLMTHYPKLAFVVTLLAMLVPMVGLRLVAGRRIRDPLVA